MTHVSLKFTWQFWKWNMIGDVLQIPRQRHGQCSSRFTWPSPSFASLVMMCCIQHLYIFTWCRRFWIQKTLKLNEMIVIIKETCHLVRDLYKSTFTQRFFASHGRYVVLDWPLATVNRNQERWPGPWPKVTQPTGRWCQFCQLADQFGWIGTTALPFRSASRWRYNEAILENLYARNRFVQHVHDERYGSNHAYLQNNRETKKTAGGSCLKMITKTMCNRGDH